MQEITQEMTVRNALSFLSPAEQINLRFWAEEFGIQLREFHMGHIKTYESLRLRIASREVVTAEVSALLDLLESVGASEEIRRCYQALRETDELSPEERASLPERARKYIDKLESELQEVEARNHRTESHLRKANWAKWSR
jgi:predicted nuclease with TOPRIM domain